MSDEELIAALADEYARWTAAPYVPDDWQRNNGDDLARAHLLPVVRAYADQRAAGELREMKRILGGYISGLVIQERIDALTAEAFR